MSTWENQYRQSAGQLASPASLDERIFQRARQHRPAHRNGRLASGAAGTFAAVAVVLLLAHPAQYLGALTPQAPASVIDTTADPLRNWELQELPEAEPEPDPWQELRVAVSGGQYQSLCEQWRENQQAATEHSLPRDLVQEARQHCRPLSIP